jgi:hypothetical protein
MELWKKRKGKSLILSLLIVPPIYGHISPIQSTAWVSFAGADRVNISKLTLLHPEQMAIRGRNLACSIKAGKANVNVYSTMLNINHIPSVYKFHCRRKSKMAGGRVCTPGIRV